MSEIWIPPSYRFRAVNEARQAARDYDSNLDFGFNERTQQWCVYLKRGTMPGSAESDLPVLGFQQIPTRDEVQKRLYETDALRHGKEILDSINRHNDDIREAREKKTKDADRELAEVLEWAYRKTGSDEHPGQKVFINRKD